jgi:hypothetical protein
MYRVLSYEDGKSFNKFATASMYYVRLLNLSTVFNVSSEYAEETRGIPTKTIDRESIKAMSLVFKLFFILITRRVLTCFLLSFV